MKVKPVFLLVITLIIGFSLGMLTSAHIRHNRMKSVRMFSSERHFKEVIYRIIEPSEEQQKELEPILKTFGKEGSVIQKNFREEFDKHNSLYWEKIESVLSEEQINMLEDANKKRRKQMKHFKPDSTRRGRGDSRRGPPREWSKDTLQKELPSE